MKSIRKWLNEPITHNSLFVGLFLGYGAIVAFSIWLIY